MPVNVTGVQATLKQMRKFDPDLAKQMNMQIKTAMMKLHRRIWNTIRHTLVSNPLYTLLNHNRDVDTLHFKYASNSSK